MKVVIIGSGNVATVLGRRAMNAGHIIMQVMSRQEEHAAFLAEELNCSFTSAFEEINMSGDFYIIAVSDDSLLEMNGHLFLKKKLVVHTAGSVPKTVLRKVSNSYGVLYPLQSLRKENTNTYDIPLLVDANNAKNLSVVSDFANTLSGNVRRCSDDERLKLHIAAIMVNNFSNHLYALAEDYCCKERVDFKLLLPLIEETAKRLHFFSPQAMQTGPAARSDMGTINKHLEALLPYPELKAVYEIFSKSIISKKTASPV